MKDERTAKSIIIQYDDGTEKILEKGCCWSFEEIDEAKQTMTLCSDMVGMKGSDLLKIVSAAIDIGIRLGMFDDKENENETD